MESPCSSKNMPVTIDDLNLEPGEFGGEWRAACLCCEMDVLDLLLREIPLAAMLACRLKIGASPIWRLQMCGLIPLIQFRVDFLGSGRLD